MKELEQSKWWKINYHAREYKKLLNKKASEKDIKARLNKVTKDGFRLKHFFKFYEKYLEE